MSLARQTIASPFLRKRQYRLSVPIQDKKITKVWHVEACYGFVNGV